MAINRAVNLLTLLLFLLILPLRPTYKNRILAIFVFRGVMAQLPLLSLS